MSTPAIFCEMSPSALWRVGGERPRAFLHSMLTQDVESIHPGTGAFAALLDEKGRLHAIVRVLAVDESSLILECDQGSISKVESDLVRLAPLGRAEMTRDDRVTFRSVGNALSDLVDEPAFSHREQDGAIVVRTPFGVDVLAEPDASSRWRALLIERATHVDARTIDAYRIKARIPLFGIDVSDQTLINETPLIEMAVSFTKGCYPGQESVARVHNLGGVRQKLIALQANARPGDRVFNVSGDDVGRVTSAAVDRDGAGVCFAYVKAEAADAGELRVRNEPATVIDGSHP